MVKPVDKIGVAEIGKVLPYHGDKSEVLFSPRKCIPEFCGRAQC
jgi:hypothetical protein